MRNLKPQYIIYTRRKESCNIFPVYRWETEAYHNILRVIWIYTRSLEHSWALKPETVSYVSAQEEEGMKRLANISRQTVEWISTEEDADLGCSAASRKEGENG